ncbi:MAG: hypothetical protein IM638_01290 [Bacteroidetes bacterium]|nr:hypothetical protein [Bacteroidota bacterium]
MAHQKPRKNELRKEIAALIDSIKNQSDRIGTTRNVPQTDIDLILHSIEQLHRKAVVFSYLNTLPDEEETPETVVMPQPVVIAAVPEKKPEPEITAPEPPKVEPVAIAEVKAPEPPKAEPVAVPEVKAPEPPKAEPVAVPEVKAPEPPKAEPKAPQPAATGKDVRSLIGFNEKLMFLRNLFGGDAAAYDEALNHINSSSSPGEAESFVSVLQSEYRWSADSEPAELFRNVVKRRFS